MKTLSLTSYAKLNLYLEVLNKRPDNYHSIVTLFERIGLSDRIRLRLTSSKQISISSSGLRIPLDGSNLILKAARLLRKELRVKQGVDIHISKRIPVSAGLGGGSSNAACVLTGLNQLWALKLSLKQLSGLARKIGADTCFFLHNCSFASANSRGDRIKPLKLRVRLWHIIVAPRLKVSSASIYKRWDQTAKTAGELGSCQSKIRRLKSAVQKKDISLLSRLIFNSLEEPAAARYSVISRARFALSDLGLKAISMSGSGSAVFSLASSRKEAYRLAGKLKAKSRNWEVFVARTA